MPHTDETFYKMKCGWVDDPKVAALGRLGAIEACLARYIFGQMIDYARRELTDGLVPAEIVPQLAHPLDAADAMRIAMRLTEDATYGPLCGWHADRNAFRILAYPKWNDTREEVQARTAAGQKAARARWDANGMRPASDATRIHRARAQVHTEQEQEQEKTSSARAGAGADETEDDDDFDELTNVAHALLVAHGAIAREQTGAWVHALLDGKLVDDRRRYVVGSIRRDPAKVYREATSTVTPAASARRQPPPAGRICHRCSKTGHAPDDCPTLATGAPRDDRERVAAVGGPQLARDLLKPAADAMRHTPDAAAAAEDDGPPNPDDYPY